MSHTEYSGSIGAHTLSAEKRELQCEVQSFTASILSRDKSVHYECIQGACESL